MESTQKKIEEKSREVIEAHQKAFHLTADFNEAQCQLMAAVAEQGGEKKYNPDIYRMMETANNLANLEFKAQEKKRELLAEICLLLYKDDGTFIHPGQLMGEFEKFRRLCDNARSVN